MQESVEIRIYQGESQEAEENELLGQFSFADFAKAARGEVQIDVTFEINTDGIVSVTATDRATGQAASTRITLSSGLSEGEIENIIVEGRTNRLETTAAVDDGDQVIGSIPLVSVPADTPVVFEGGVEPQQQDLDETEILPWDDAVAPAAEAPIAAAAPEAPAAPPATPAAVASDEPGANEMEAYVENLPEDAFDLEAGDEGEALELLGADDDVADLDLLEANEVEAAEIEIDAVIEAGDDELALTEAVELGGSDPALTDTRPIVGDEALFEEPGTDLSTLEDADPEEAS
jgi:hypothetical protein